MLAAPTRVPLPRCAAALLAVLALSGCGMIGGSRDEEWALDEPSGRYYRPDLVAQSTEPVRERFPTLTTIDVVTWADGRFTAPDGRDLIPAQDDYWWQAVIELDAGEAASLLVRTDAIGSAVAAEPITDEELREALVPTLEGFAGTCPEGWADATPALAREGSSNVSEDGDLLDVAVICPGGTQLVVSLREM